MNNKYLPICVFLCLLVSFLFSGHCSFKQAKLDIEADLNQALCRMMKEKTDFIITTDTIRAYKHLQESSDGPILLAITDEKFTNGLKIKKLRNNALISFAVLPSKNRKERSVSNVIYSDTLIIEDSNLGETVALRGYVEASFATVFSVSDQRMPMTLAAASLIWALFYLITFRRKKEEMESAGDFGGMRFCPEENTFYGSDGMPIHFTPMQQQLMEMFWNKPSHSVSKDDICSTLWPRKEDANDTLYTLIRRVKPVLEESSRLKLTADRGKCYTLEINKLDD